MPQNFLSCDRSQPMLLPPDLRDWLPEDHLAWFMIDAAAELELEPPYASYRSDGHGAAAHEPRMMVTLFAYAYAVGERSSLGIERRCRERVAFRVICANQVPDHATIARFRVRHQEALAELFGGVLRLCAKAGIVDVGVVAVDGTKLAANASDGAIRTYEQIAREIIAEAARIDAAEDELHGEARGDELPAGLRTPNGRRAWLRQAKEELERERDERPEPVARDRAERLETCQRRLTEDWRAENRANRAFEAYRGRTSQSAGHSTDWSPRWSSSAQATAREACPNATTALSPSPCSTGRTPSVVATARLRTWSWSASAARIAFGSSSQRREEPSMSVSMNVTTPSGREAGIGPPRTAVSLPCKTTRDESRSILPHARLPASDPAAAAVQPPPGNPSEAPSSGDYPAGYGTRCHPPRARLKPLVVADRAVYARCGLRILTGEPWDLDHIDHDRTRYGGPRKPGVQPGDERPPAAGRMREFDPGAGPDDELKQLVFCAPDFVRRGDVPAVALGTGIGRVDEPGLDPIPVRPVLAFRIPGATTASRSRRLYASSAILTARNRVAWRRRQRGGSLPSGEEAHPPAEGCAQRAARRAFGRTAVAAAAAAAPPRSSSPTSPAQYLAASPPRMLCMSRSRRTIAAPCPTST